MNYEMTDVFVLLAGAALVIAFLVMFIIKFIVSVYFPFVDAYDHIKSKIMFSNNYDEQKYWIKEKKRLFVSYIPLVGEFLARKMKSKKKKH